MDVSIILPSYNGAETLPRTLAALDRVVAPPGGMEIILVDNNSTDDTARLIHGFAEGRVVQVLSEPRQGKSHALNTALDVAQGALIVFTDDDTLAEPDWVMAYVRAAEAHPDIGVFAGQIRPDFSKPAPTWLSQLADAGRSFGCTALGRPDGPYEPLWVKGANFAVRASALATARFDVAALNFGASGQTGGGEDTEFVRSVVGTDSGRVRFVGEACVRHIVRAGEMTLGSIFARYVRIGEGQVNMQTAERPYTRIGVTASILRSAALIAAYAVTLQRHRAISQIVTLAAQTGRMKALMRR